MRPLPFPPCSPENRTSLRLVLPSHLLAAGFFFSSVLVSVRFSQSYGLMAVRYRAEVCLIPLWHPVLTADRVRLTKMAALCVGISKMDALDYLVF